MTLIKSKELTLKWHARQYQALMTRATELLFGGASEGGKSTFVRLALLTWSSYIPFLQSFVYRKYYSDVIGNYMTGETSFPELLRPWISEKIVMLRENEIEFWNGALISLWQMRTDEDLQKAQGKPKQVLVLDEATQIEPRFVKELRGWVRMPNTMKDQLPEQLAALYPKLSPDERRAMFPRIIHTANPIGVGVGYYRRLFVQPREPFAIEAARDEDGGFLLQYIPSRIEDNPDADPVAQRKRLLSLGEARAAALIGGIWDAPTGDYFKEYDDEKHAVPNFKPNNAWFKFMTFDWGSHEPFGVYWWCVSDGNEFLDDNGDKRWFPRGALIAYREWYGCDEKEPARGLGLRNQAIADGIRARTRETIQGPTITDSLPFQDRGLERAGKKYLLADVFAEHGVPLLKGNTARIHGWSQMRDRLIGVSDGEGGTIPLIYFCYSCVYVREYIPALTYSDTNEEDATEHGEATHSCDCVRLACTARPIVLEEVKKQDNAPRNSISTQSVLKTLITDKSRTRLS